MFRASMLIVAGLALSVAPALAQNAPAKPELSEKAAKRAERNQKTRACQAQAREEKVSARNMGTFMHDCITGRSGPAASAAKPATGSKAGEWTRKQWDAAKKEWAKNNAKWSACQKKSAAQKLSMRQSRTFLADCMRS